MVTQAGNSVRTTAEDRPGRLRRTFERLKRAWAEEGGLRILGACATKAFDCSIAYHYYKFLKQTETFSFRGQNYLYLCHRYNRTWRNDRAVEVPIMWEFVKRYSGKRILEIGNVLAHYFKVDHDVVDKYERAKGVINQDVVDFNPEDKYDLIVSISTLEHVGWDEHPREPGKLLRAIENLKACLAPDGLLAVSFPLGYNSELDGLWREGVLGFTNMYCLRRVTSDNEWVEVAPEDAEVSPYDYLLFYSRNLVIGIVERLG